MHVGTFSTISEADELDDSIQPDPELLQVTPAMLMQDQPSDVQRKLLFHVKRFGEFQVWNYKALDCQIFILKSETTMLKFIIDVNLSFTGQVPSHESMCYT